jgi:hypothetical protein
MRADKTLKMGKDMKDTAAQLKSLQSLYNPDLIGADFAFGNGGKVCDLLSDLAVTFTMALQEQLGNLETLFKEFGELVKKYSVIIDACSSPNFPPTHLGWMLKDSLFVEASWFCILVCGILHVLRRELGHFNS